MKKTLLLSFALFLSAMTFAARYELPLDKLGESKWGNATTEGNGSATYVAEGTGVGTIVVTEAYPTDEGGGTEPSAIIDFESDQLGQEYPCIAWRPEDLTAVVENRPGGGGKALHIINNNWNSYPKFLVTLPEGKTLADIKKISFNLYFERVDTVDGQIPNSYKTFDYFLGAQGTDFTPNEPTGSVNNLVGNPSDNPGQTWLTKEFVPTIEDKTLLSLNKFDFGIGMNINEAGNYFLDNITFVMKGDDSSDFEVVDSVLVAYHGAGGNVVIPGNLGITAIGDSVFVSNDSITSVVIPEGVTTIGNNAFSWCAYLASVIFPNTLEAIGIQAFQSCPLNSLTIPNSVKSIGCQAFSHCFILQSVLIPKSVESIDNWAFEGCWSLSAINVVEDNMYYSSDEGVLYNKNKTTLLTYPGGKNTVYFSIPNSVTKILTWAFEGSNFTSISIPNSVVSIQDEAFPYCQNLEDLTVYWTTPLTVNSAAFKFVNTSACALHVPVGKVAAYQADPVWRTFGTIDEQAPVSGVTLDKTTAFILVNDTLQLTATVEPRNASDKNVTWSSSDESVATVSTSGLVTAISEGSATITVTTEEGNFSASCTITVANSDFVVADGILIAYHGAGGDVVIPGNLGITEIGSYAFASTRSLNTVTIPEGVTTIDFGAFWGSNMTSISIPSSVISIGDLVFGVCENLSDINVQEDNMNYSSSDGVLYSKDQTILYCYPGGINSNTFSIPNTVVYISQYAFYQCLNLDSITIPNSVKSIGYQAFNYCTNVQSVLIPNSVESIDSWAFGGCWSLSAINVVEDNMYYSSDEGVLYNKNKTTLLTYPGGKNTVYFSIPNSVTNILAGAFWGSNFTSISIPNSVVSIQDEAFIYCQNLEDLTVNWTTPLTVNSAAFEFVNTSACSLHVPIGKVAAYQADPVWGTFGTIDEQAPVSGVSLDKTTVIISVNDTLQLTATVEPRSASDKNVTWSSSDESVATVSTSGLVTTLSEGSATITVTTEEGNFSASCTITVVANSDFVVVDGILIGYRGAGGDVVIPGDLGITEIGNSVFYDNYDITSVIIPEGVIAIDDNAFSWCYNLVTVTLPNTLTTIGNTVFADCSFNSITIPNSVKSIGDEAFIYCGGLQSVLIPNSVESIGSWAFGDCWGLLAINVAEDNMYYSSEDGVLYNKDKTVLHTYPSGKNTADFSIPNSVTNILGGAFFATSFTSISIPNSVVSIQDRAFSYCQLENVTVNWAEPLILSTDDDIFYGIFYGSNTATCTLHVPYGTKALYEAADVWKDFGTIVEQANDDIPVVVPDETQPVGADGKGAIELSLSIPSDATLTGSFEIQFMEGMTLDEELTVLSPALSGSFFLTFTYEGNNTWLIEIKPNALKSSKDIEYQKIMKIAYTVSDNVSEGKYEVAIKNLDFIQDDGTPIKEDLLTVPINVDWVATSIENIDNSSFYAYFINSTLTIKSSHAETITIYSATGVRLYSTKKNAGMIEIPFSSIRGSVFIIKGSLSGTIKIKP